MKKLTKDEETTQKTYDLMAQDWAGSHEITDFWAAEVAVFRTFLPAGRILEVGAGSGRDVKLLLASGYDYTGTDFSPGLIKVAQAANPGVNFQQTSVYDLAFDEQFDGFWCAATLLHIPKKRLPEALAAIYKNLKPGAIGFISMKRGDHEVLEDWEGNTDRQRFVAYWEAGAFKQALAQSHFEVLWEGQKAYKDILWLTFIVRAVNR